MRGRGISFHGPVNSGEAEGHRSKPKVWPNIYSNESMNIGCFDLGNILYFLLQCKRKL